MTQERQVTIRRQMSDDGEWRYQVWPSDLPNNAPTPSWQKPSDFPDSVAPGIMSARLDNAFEPLPSGEEEAVMPQEEWDSYLGPIPEDDASKAQQVDLPDDYDYAALGVCD